MSGTIPVFSRDGKSVFYLRSESPGPPTELWRADVGSEKSEKVLPGIFMAEFDLSDDAREVLYSVQLPGKPSQVWVASLDRRSAPQLISSSGGDSPYFGPDGRIVYRSFDGTNYYLEQMNRDGSRRSKVVPYPIGNVISISPDRRWITTAGAIPGVGGGTFAVPIAGGAPRRICSGCPVTWSLDGKALYLSVRKSSLTDPGKNARRSVATRRDVAEAAAFGNARSRRAGTLSRLIPYRRIWNRARSRSLRICVRENNDAPESVSDPLEPRRKNQEV
jgi:hypothetical protein